jgi:hypothetical protein
MKRSMNTAGSIGARGQNLKVLGLIVNGHPRRNGREQRPLNPWLPLAIATRAGC